MVSGRSKPSFFLKVKAHKTIRIRVMTRNSCWNCRKRVLKPSGLLSPTPRWWSHSLKGIIGGNVYFKIKTFIFNKLPYASYKLPQIIYGFDCISINLRLPPYLGIAHLKFSRGSFQFQSLLRNHSLCLGYSVNIKRNPGKEE